MKYDKPSQTAWGVAAICLGLSVDRSHPGLVTQDYAETLAHLMRATGEMSRFSVRFFQTPIGLMLLRRVSDKSLPGQFQQFGKRKKYFEAQARDAIVVGAKQVLVLGAGYDVLCLRMAREFTDVTFLEIDHPATARAKKLGLDSLGTPSNLKQIPVDLADTPLQEVLSEEDQWDETACSFVVAEGLTQYLREDVVKNLFETIDSNTGKASRFGFTFIGWREQENRPEAGPFTDKFLRSVAKRGEPWIWGMAVSGISDFFAGTPWKLIEDVEVAGIEYFACVGK